MVRKKRKSRRKYRKKRTKTRKRRGGGPEIGMLAKKFINFYNQHESLQKALQEKFPKVKNLGQLIRNLTDNQVERALELSARPKTAINDGMSGGGGPDGPGLEVVPFCVWVVLVLLAILSTFQHDSEGRRNWGGGGESELERKN
jgi:hypothetical protein